MSMQRAPQRARDGAHPVTQRTVDGSHTGALGGQASPQRPQFVADESEASHPSSARPLQSPKRGSHVPTAHAPLLHRAVALGIAHTIPHAPQLVRSVASGTHRPTHSDCPSAQPAAASARGTSNNGTSNNVTSTSASGRASERSSIASIDPSRGPASSPAASSAIASRRGSSMRPAQRASASPSAMDRTARTRIDGSNSRVIVRSNAGRHKRRLRAAFTCAPRAR